MSSLTSPDNILSRLGVTFQGAYPMMAFYTQHCMDIQDRIIMRPQYLNHCWTHALHISLGSFRVGSHWLHIQTNHQIDRVDQICHLCTLAKVKTKFHFIFWGPIYYKIGGGIAICSKSASPFSPSLAMSTSSALLFTFRRPQGSMQALFPSRQVSDHLITSFFLDGVPLKGLKEMA